MRVRMEFTLFQQTFHKLARERERVIILGERLSIIIIIPIARMEGSRGGRDFICQVGEFQLLYVHQFTVAAVSTLRRFPIPDAAEQKRAADACLDAGRGDLILKSTFDT